MSCRQCGKEITKENRINYKRSWSGAQKRVWEMTKTQYCRDCALQFKHASLWDKAKMSVTTSYSGVPKTDEIAKAKEHLSKCSKKELQIKKKALQAMGYKTKDIDEAFKTLK